MSEPIIFINTISCFNSYFQNMGKFRVKRKLGLRLALNRKPHVYRRSGELHHTDSTLTSPFKSPCFKKIRPCRLSNHTHIITTSFQHFIYKKKQTNIQFTNAKVICKKGRKLVSNQLWILVHGHSHGVDFYIQRLKK